MNKILNIKNIIILLAVLAVFHISIGLFASPFIKPIIVDNINHQSSYKVSIEKFNLWPLTISATLKNLEVLNPDNSSERFIQANDTSVYINPMSLFCGHLIVSSVRINDLKVNYQVKQKKDKEESVSITTPVSEKKDLFSGTYVLLKDKLSKKAVKNENYPFEINNLSIDNGLIRVRTEEGVVIGLDKARIEAGRIKVNPPSEVTVGKFRIKGGINSQGLSAGSLDLLFLNESRRGNKSFVFDIMLKNVNLERVSFIFENSIPVKISKGTLDIESKTSILNGNIDSKDSLSLSNHFISPKETEAESSDFMPLPVICDTLNSINPVNLSFEITGSLEKPEFRGFQKSLMSLVMSNTKVIQEQIINRGFEALGEYLNKRKKKKEAETPQAPTAE